MSTTTAPAVDHTDHIIMLQRVLHQIESDPEHWAQSDWVSGEMNERYENGQYIAEPTCGTSFCFAGWAAHLDPDVQFAGFSRVHVSGGGTQSISVWAEQRLGLTEPETMLFSAANTLDDLRDHVKQITARMLAEMYPPPPVKTYDVTVTTTRTHVYTTTAVDEEAAIAATQDEYSPRQGRTYEAKEVKPEPEPEPRDDVVTVTWEGTQRHLGPSVHTVTATSEAEAITQVRVENYWAVEGDEPNRRVWNVATA